MTPLTLLFFALGMSPSWAALGPIATDQPAPAGGSLANTAPPNSFLQGHNPPFPTNSWWAGYAAGDGTAVVAGPFPYESSLTNSAFLFGMSTNRQFDGVSIMQPTQNDWSAGFVEHSGNAADRRAVSWDTQTVTLQYFTAQSTLTSYLVPGSPYLTFNFSQATPVFQSQQGVITSFAGQTVTNGGAAISSSGTKFKLVNSAGTYIIYTLSNITLSTNGQIGSTSVVASAPFTGVVRMVKLNNTAHEALLDQHFTTYPTAVTTDNTISGNTSTLSFTWNVVGTPASLLMLTWPHHRIKMTSTSVLLPTTSLNYLTTKGWMYPAVGNQWLMAYDLPIMSWNAPRAPDQSCVATIIQGLEFEIGKLAANGSVPPPVPGDFYFWGSSTNAQARLALIAEEMGRTDLIPTVTDWLKTTFANWFDPSAPTQAAYETAWGGMVNQAGALNVNVDFGNGFYNDHHFHYGYFLTIAAVIAKYDSAWLAQHKTYIDWFMRDIVNPSTADPFFPVVRHRDWFAGHSWASGIANGAGSRDQESTGEAINAYYGAMLWATVTGDTAMVDYARFLLSTEQHGAQVYWHMLPSSDPNARDQPYPEAGVRSLVTIGNVEDWQAGAWTFFSAQKVQINGIQILPLTPTSEDLYEDAWVQAVLAYTQNEISDPTISDDWKCLIYAAYAQHDPEEGANLSSSLTSWGSGNTYSNQMYWVSTRPNSSGVPICSALPSNPVGDFVLQDVASGLFVVSSASNPNLVVSAVEQNRAASFDFAFSPNAGTIMATATSQFVTADVSGNFTLSAARTVAQGFETFIVRQKVGAASGVFTILAGSNKQYVTIAADGSLINNGATESVAAGFRLLQPLPPAVIPANPEGAFVLQDVQSGLYVEALTGTGNLVADVTSQSNGAAFTLAAAADGGVGGTIQLSTNQQFVTADISGDFALAAARAVAQGWEMFQITPKANAASGVYTILALSNNDYVTIASDGSLVNNGTELQAAGFQLSAPTSLTVQPTNNVPNPVGSFVLQNVASGLFVESLAGSGNLVADIPSQSAGTTFDLAAAPDNAPGGTIFSTSNQQFVTADISGNLVLQAARLVAQGWEMFTIVQKAGAADGIVTIQAQSNNMFITVAADGTLINNGAVSAGAEFRLLAPVTVPANPAGPFVLQDADSGLFVESLAGTGNLVADSTSKSSGAVFNFTAAPDNSVGGTVEAIGTQMFVTADISGSFALAAARQVAQAWEFFTVTQKDGAATGVFTILAASNNRFVTIDGDGTLINNGSTTASAAGFHLISP